MSGILAQSDETSTLNVIIESDNMENSDIGYKIENYDQHNNFPLSEVSNDTTTIQCFMNQDNTMSFINNSNVFQAVEDDCGEIYYACIGSTNDGISQQDQVLQLIPQNQISNYIISDKDYSNMNFITESMLNGSDYYSSLNSSANAIKYEPYDSTNIDTNLFKCINNHIGKQICDICSLEFPSKRSYLKHMSIHENDREFKCSWCKLSYNYEVNLLVHVAIIHPNESAVEGDDNETSYKCAICSCLFSRKKAHQAHCLIHQVDEELPCEHCSSLFKSRLLLERHLYEHKIGNHCSENKLWTNYLRCKVCHELFDNVGNIKKHYAQFHPKSQPQWSHDDLTAKVDEVFSLSETIDKTLESIPGGDGTKRKSSKIACQTIKLYAQGKSSKSSSSLDIQGGSKSDLPKSINKRGRPKKSESNLSTKSRNSHCNVCNKTFKTPILLRRHEVTHTGVKEFECPVCKKGFTQKSSVKIHMAVHDNVKNFSCQYCFKSFTYEHNMNTHIKVIHKNKTATGNYGNSCSGDGREINSSTGCSRMRINTTKDDDINQSELDSNNHPPKRSTAMIQIDTTTVTTTGGDSVAEVVNDDAEISQYLWSGDTSQIETTHPTLVDSVCYQINQSNNDETNVDDIYVQQNQNFPKTVVDWECKSQPVTENRCVLLSEDVERVDKETGQLQVHEVIRDQITGFRRFRCRYCCKLYHKSCDLSRHIRIHTHQKPFPCYMCHKTFRLKSVLKNHYKSHWKLKEYSCDVCQKVFNLKQTLKVHRQLHSANQMRFSCNLCQKRFNTSFHHKYHMRTAHTRPQNSIDPNNNMTSNGSTIIATGNDEDNGGVGQLSEIVTGKSPIKTFIWNDLLNQPVAIPDLVDKHRSSLSNQNMSTLPQLFKCNHCGKSYKFKKYLNEHLKDHLSANRANICHFCNKSFLTFRSMQQHLRTQHLNRRKFFCHQCPAFFITKASLSRHGLVHSDSKPFACPLCFRRFKAKIYCDRHIVARKCAKKAVLIDTSKSLNDHHQNLQSSCLSVDPRHVNGAGSIAVINIQHGDAIQSSSNQRHHNNHLAHASHQQHHHLESEVLINTRGSNNNGNSTNNDHQSDVFSAFRLEDLHDLQTSTVQSSNVLVTNYVNDFSSFSTNTAATVNDKYMIVSLENQSATKDIQSGLVTSVGPSGVGTGTASCVNGSSTVGSGAAGGGVVVNGNSVSVITNGDLNGNVTATAPTGGASTFYTSNLLIDESSLVEMTRTVVDQDSCSDPSENILGLLEGQIGVTPIDIGSIFSMQNYTGDNLASSLSTNQIIDTRDHQQHIHQDIDYHHHHQQHQDIYYYQTINEIQQEPIPKSSLADKFPILKASLFSEDDLSTNEKIATISGNVYKAYSFLCSSTNGGGSSIGCSGNVGAVGVAVPGGGGGGTLFNRTSYYIDNHQQPMKFYHGCANCSQQFKDSTSLVHHVKTTHKIRKDFVCNVCHKAFSAKLSLWAHSKTHIDSRSFGCFVCIACNQRFISVPSLSRHVRMQHNDNLNLYRCTHCQKVYKTTRELDSHIKQLISEYDALIINSNLIETTELTNEVILTGFCPSKSLIGSCAVAIGNNNNTSSMITVPSSSTAGNIIVSSSSAEVDIDKVYFGELDDQIDASQHDGLKLSFKELIKAAAKETGTGTAKGKWKSSHPLGGTSAVPSLSSLSGSTGNGSKLKKALTTQSITTTIIDPLLTYPYSCSICHKGFNRASNLQQHLSVHTKLKPYQCSKCNNRFRHRCSLKTHEATKHSAITKLLSCHLCFKLLRSQVALRNHMKIHVRNFVGFRCEVCDKTFTTSNDWSIHTKQKHGAEGNNENSLMSVLQAESIDVGGEQVTKRSSIATVANFTAMVSMTTVTEPTAIIATGTLPPQPSLSSSAAETTTTLTKETDIPSSIIDSSSDTTIIDLQNDKVKKKQLVPEMPKKLIKCLSCSFVFSTRSKYQSHFCVQRCVSSVADISPASTAPAAVHKSSDDLHHQSKTSNTCCGKVFESTFQLLSHLQKVHQQMIHYNCAQCNIMFTQESTFINHQRSVHHL